MLPSVMSSCYFQLTNCLSLKSKDLIIVLVFYLWRADLQLIEKFANVKIFSERNSNLHRYPVKINCTVSEKLRFECSQTDFNLDLLFMTADVDRFGVVVASVECFCTLLTLFLSCNNRSMHLNINWENYLFHQFMLTNSIVWDTTGGIHWPFPSWIRPLESAVDLLFKVVLLNLKMVILYFGLQN